MIKFTKEEVNLCKQVAERHRKTIEYGDWYWSKSHNKPLLAMNYGFETNEQDFMGVFKIWTISDCLEFLKGKGGFIVDAYDSIGDSFSIEIETARGQWEGTRWLKTRKRFSGKGLLEACLKAVLAVLEEK